MNPNETDHRERPGIPDPPARTGIHCSSKSDFHPATPTRPRRTRRSSQARMW